MRFFVDARAVLEHQGGVARSVLSTVAAASAEGRAEFVVLNNYPDKWTAFPNVRVLGYKGPASSSIEARTWWEQTVLRRLVRESGADAVWSPWNWGIPVSLGCPSLLTVHDLIPLRRRNPMGSRYRSLVLRLALWHSLHSASAIATPSEFTRNELIKRSIRPSRVETIHWGVSSAFSPRADSSRYDRPVDADDPRELSLLYVGGWEERKNLAALFDACALVAAGGDTGKVKLRLTGSVEKLAQPAAAALQRASECVDVEFLGRVAEDQLPDVYRSADLFVFPSLEEGFGFPPLEAQASGIPVICGSADSIPEIVGDGAMIVDVTNVSELASAIHRLALDPSLRKQLRERGLASARRFSWRTCGMRYLAALERLVHRGL
ncbi:MAG: glycosyltransferase family 4 protein [Gammaproteobacteria bacterium]|nr:glycosyltransferase family 4 protein [Gammaproteobacteria bacterium]